MSRADNNKIVFPREWFKAFPPGLALRRCAGAFAILALGSCTEVRQAAQHDEPERQAFYAPGLPNFQLEVMPGGGTGGDGGIDLMISIPRTSLVFVRSAGGYAATIAVEVQLIDPGFETIRSIAGWNRTIEFRTYEQTRERERVLLDTTLACPPGRHMVRVSLTDENTEKEAVRNQEVTVREVSEEGPFAGEIRLFSSEKGGDHHPFFGVQLPMPMDSILCALTVHNITPGDSLAAQCSILRYGSDSTVASPPYAMQPLRGSMEHLGLREQPEDTLTFAMISGDRRGGTQTVETHLIFRSPGIYTIVIDPNVIGTFGRDTVLLPRASRTVVVMRSGFPRPSTLRELIQPLIYIAGEEEFDTLVAEEDPVRLRQSFDQFWLKLGGSPLAASNLLKAYYTRVEEANTFFSEVKDGWRTDRGMLYVVLGPPVSVMTGLNVEIWRYTRSEQDPVNTYVFNKIDLVSFGWPFDHYVLERKAYYDQPWLGGVDRWRRGAAF